MRIAAEHLVSLVALFCLMACGPGGATVSNDQFPARIASRPHTGCSPHGPRDNNSNSNSNSNSDSDSESDSDDCGGCCGCGSASCEKGKCKECPATAPNACGANCLTNAALLKDSQNCGACGKVCPQGNACVNGACAVSCPAGQVNCAGQCVTTSRDAANCVPAEMPARRATFARAAPARCHA